jgi:hypothetical protein
MSHQLIEANDDLRHLRDDGYNVAILGAALVVRDIPYVNEKREVKYDGVLVSTLNLNGEILNKPDTHQIRFAGERPCNSDGEPLEGLSLNAEVVRFTDSLSAHFHFSSKPQRGHYETYHEKIRTYSALLSGSATTIDPFASPLTRRVTEPEDDDSPFHYLDTASARADINMITAKLAVEKIAIVGLGGTGSYVLDLLAKTPVKEIHLFDGDTFSSHNAFRAPGAASKDCLHKQPQKVDYFKEIYSRMHKGIITHPANVDSANIEELSTMTSVFLCIDAGKGKKYIVEKLEEFNLPFFDTGMGLYVNNETLGGILRVVTSDKNTRGMARVRMSLGEDEAANEYDKNIQIADLNSLNAILAVMRWKKIKGFYIDTKHAHYDSFTIGSGMLLHEDIYESN